MQKLSLSGKGAHGVEDEAAWTEPNMRALHSNHYRLSEEKVCAS